MLIYAGIDEAGYGPMLGPLCVGLSVLAIRGYDGAHAPAPPDVWALASEAVTRSARDALRDGRVAIDDSKKLKLSNGSRTRHPLLHLERGVVACARRLWGEEHAVPADDAALLARLGSSASEHGTCVELPLGSDASTLRLLGVCVQRAFEAAGVDVIDLACRRLEPQGFNERLAHAPSKAAVAWSVVRELIARVWLSAAARREGEPVRLVIDRQSGRTSYAHALRSCVGDAARIEVLGESAERSVYTIEDGVGRRLRVLVEREAESTHFPVALASMIAKFVRELAMLRFNRAWGARVPELKPTAGYVTDARRWLADVRASGSIDEEELRALVRKA